MNVNMPKRKVPNFAVTLGDPAGTGPELIAKSLYNNPLVDKARFFIVGDKRILEMGIAIAGKGPDFRELVKSELANPSLEQGVYLIDQKNIDPKDFRLGVLSTLCGQVMGQDLAESIRLSQAGLVDGIIFGPLSKEALNKGGANYPDELHYFADLMNLDSNANFGEINKVGSLWLGRVTSHMGIGEVASKITVENVLKGIELTNQIMLNYGEEKRKILVAALNPHCGDGGLFGLEESIIAKGIQCAKEKGIDAHGPYPSDTIFLRHLNGDGNAIVGMYHDQVQIGGKLLGFSKAVTIQAGLPIPITTPAHGNGLDLAGKGIANENPTLAALDTAYNLVVNSHQPIGGV